MIGRITANILVAAGLLLFAVVPATSVSLAQLAIREIPGRGERAEQTLRSRHFKTYQEAMELMNAEPPLYGQALSMLLDIDYSKKPSKYNPSEYEKAVFLNTIATIYKAQENYEKALEYYLMVLAKGEEIPYDLEDGVNFMVGQIYFILEDYDASIVYLERWLAPQLDPPSNNLIFIANAYYNAGADERAPPEKMSEYYRAAIKLINQAINYEVAKDKLGKENWYVFLRMLHNHMEDDEIVLEISELLVSCYPGKKGYWTELSGLYAREASRDELDETKIKEFEVKQLVTLEMAHRQQLLTRARELESMSQLFLYHEIPYKSSKILAKSIDEELSEETFRNLDLLSQGYLQSKDYEKAIEPLAKAAALSDNGEHYMRLANLYLQLDTYDEAADAIDKAVDKGGISRTDLARFLQGQALIYLERFDDARAAFREAAKDDRTEKSATTWLKYIDSEEKRIKDIREYLN